MLPMLVGTLKKIQQSKMGELFLLKIAILQTFSNSSKSKFKFVVLISFRFPVMEKVTISNLIFLNTSIYNAINGQAM